MKQKMVISKTENQRIYRGLKVEVERSY